MSFNHFDARCELSNLVGCTFIKVESYEDAVNFWTEDKANSFSLFHEQDCCESVYLEEIIGELSDLENSPILIAEEVSSNVLPPLSEHAESYTWTFYKLSTIKGSVTLRWYGSSNGYYSESVDCHRWIKDDGE